MSFLSKCHPSSRLSTFKSIDELLCTQCHLFFAITLSKYLITKYQSIYEYLHGKDKENQVQMYQSETFKYTFACDNLRDHKMIIYLHSMLLQIL